MNSHAHFQGEIMTKEQKYMDKKNLFHQNSWANFNKSLYKASLCEGTQSLTK